MFTSPLYFTSSPDALHSHCWGEQCVVYNMASGDTHLLNKVDIDVLRRINDKPISAENLSQDFQHLFDGRADRYIQTLLSSLAMLGLIETADNEPLN